MSDLIGRRLGDFQVLRRLGRGGMADVYAARQMQLQRDVALKVLRHDQRPSDDDLRRFRREAQAAARLNHPAIVQVYDVGEIDDCHYIAQELIDGQNLSQRLQTQGPLPAHEAIDVMVQVTAALRVAHDAGITHRDIKPENIMRAEDGTIKVTDFGLARMLTSSDASTANLTRAGLTLGTPRYMSPEQIQGHSVDGRSDLYSLGVTMYHLLTGSPPFDAEEPIALAVKHLHDLPAPIDRQRGKDDVPEWLITVVARCMQKVPDQRYPSAVALQEVIEANRSGTDVTGTMTTSSTQVIPSESTSKSSSATVTLQRVTDAIAGRRRSHRRRWIRRIALAAGGVLLGAILASPMRSASVEQLLGTDTVPKADSIEIQYLTALSRNDVDGWTAVQTYFPIDQNVPGAQVRRVYHHKATLQLARLYIDQKRYRRGRECLDSLMTTASVSRLYQCVALILLDEIAAALADESRRPEIQRQLAQRVAELENENPASLEVLREVVPPSRLREIGILY
ncbi:MAG: protein kinase [Planctomycetota bacterium]